jgi:hypothetical protein
VWWCGVGVWADAGSPVVCDRTLERRYLLSRFTRARGGRVGCGWRDLHDGGLFDGGPFLLVWWWRGFFAAISPTKAGGNE